MAFLGGLAVMVLLTAGPSGTKTRVALVLAAAGAAAVLAAAVFAADAASRRERRATLQPAVPLASGEVQRRLGELGFLIARGRQDLQELAGRVRAGESAAPRGSDHLTVETGDPFMRLAYELQKAQNEAWNAVLDAARSKQAVAPDQRVGVFVNLARRMQSLSHRAIQGLDELENQVEDPDLLKGLFRVDHLSTRMRRQAESLAVIGGAASRRRWSRPVTVYEVLRSAIAEIEHYNRVKVVPPVEGTLHGSAVADVIHLLAELIENATKFAPPHTQVLVRVETVTAGLAVEVEDRGLGIPRENQRRLNELLSDIDRVNSDELLQEGRIGLLVVSALARRHGVRVQLQTNLYGGTQAVVVVPKELIGTDADDGRARTDTRSAPAEPAPAMAASAPAPASASLAAPAAPSGFGQNLDATRADRDASAGRPGEASTAAWDAPPPSAPVRSSGPEAGAARSGATAAAPTTAATGSPGRTGAGERPPLPRRRVQANLVPELRNTPQVRSDDAEIEHNPGLMAAFQRGMRSGQEDDGRADDTDGTG